MREWEWYTYSLFLFLFGGKKMNNDYFMGGPMPYRTGGYAPSYLSTQMPQTSNNNTNIVWTMGLESAKAYPLFPGRTIMLMDSENPRFFIKSVDNNGYATLKAYTFQEEPTSQPAAPTNNFITKEQLDMAIDSILDKMKEITATNKATESVEVEVEKTKSKNLL